MSSMLRPRGVLVFEVGTLAEIHRAWYRLIGVLGYPQHRWLYSEQSLHRLFDRAGLRVLQTRHFGLAPSVLFYRSMALLARAARKWRGPKAPAATSAVGSPPTTTNAEAALCRIEQFFRYRVGAIAPRIGPGTLFVAACPRDANPEVSS
jgi:hypothetical protein